MTAATMNMSEDDDLSSQEEVAITKEVRSSNLFKELERKASSFEKIESLCTRIPKQVEECQDKFNSSYNNFMRAMTGDCGPAST